MAPADVAPLKGLRLPQLTHSIIITTTYQRGGDREPFPYYVFCEKCY